MVSLFVNICKLQSNSCMLLIKINIEFEQLIYKKMFFLFGKIIFFFVLNWSYSFEEEFCNSEKFKPICLTNEILLIKNAIYGRKSYGKCIKEKSRNKEALSKISGYINCYTDVRHILEPQCAGKQSCEIIVSTISVETNCNEAFKLHLDIEYGCIKG